MLVIRVDSIESGRFTHYTVPAPLLFFVRSFYSDSYFYLLVILCEFLAVQETLEEERCSIWHQQKFSACVLLINTSAMSLVILL